MNERKLILLSEHLLPETEYQETYKATSNSSPYSFITSIYEEGLILFILSENPNRDRETYNMFPNLYKLIKMCRYEGYDYIDLLSLPEDENWALIKKYNLKTFEW